MKSKILVLRKKELLIAAAIIAAAAVFFASGYVLCRNSETKKYEDKWKIDLPDNMNLLFSAGEVYIDGSAKYSVFACKKRPAALGLLEKPAFGTAVGFEKKVVRAMTDIKNKIPVRYLPNFNENYEYLYLQGGRGIRAAYLYIIYYPDSKMLIICQDINQY